MEDERKKKLLAALGTIVDNKKTPQPFGQVVPDLKSQNLAKGALDQETFKVKSGGLGRDVTPERQMIKGGNPAIDTKQVAKKTNIKDFSKMQKDLDLKHSLTSSFKVAAEAGDKQTMDKLRRIAKKFAKGASTGLKTIPILGAAVGLLGSEDASAGVPILNAAEGVGMSASDENAMIADIRARINAQNSQSHRDRQAAGRTS